MNYIIGLTGGIGSGKSTVARILESLGYPVYYADTAAKRLMNENPSVRKALIEVFGEEVYLESGELNRTWLGSFVFDKPDLLKKLNGIVHPATGADFLNWIQEHRERTPDGLLFKEAAILYESGAAKGTQEVVTVYAPKSVRLKRVLSRDGTVREQVLARMGKQWPESEKIRRASFTIYNDGKHSLIFQTLEMLRFLREKTQQDSLPVK